MKNSSPYFFTRHPALLIVLCFLLDLYSTGFSGIFDVLLYTVLLSVVFVLGGSRYPISVIMICSGIPMAIYVIDGMITFNDSATTWSITFGAPLSLAFFVIAERVLFYIIDNGGLWNMFY